MATINIEGVATKVDTTREGVEAVQTSLPAESSIPNTFLGKETAKSIKPKGEGNVAFGVGALEEATVATDIVAIGTLAANKLETVGLTIAIGREAQYEGESEESIAIGVESLKKDAGSKNIAVGKGAGEASLTGESNIFVGVGSGNSTTTGKENVYIGTQAGTSSATGSENVCIGGGAYGGGEEGGENVAIGTEAGDGKKGSANIFIGQTAGKGAASVSNKLVIANNATKALINGVMSATEASQEIGFLGAAPAKRPKVKGSRETEAEEILKTLTKGLAELGLITDETTA